MNDQVNPSGRRMRVFDAEGTPLGADMMVPHGLDDPSNAGFADAADAGMQYGHRIRCLHRSDGPDGISLCRMWLKQGFTTPRHRHDVDCLYYVLGGSVRAGNVELHEGEGLFVPAGTVYFLEAGTRGLEVLEFRSGSAFNVEYLRNTPGHWSKVIGAISGNVTVWQEQAEPAFCAPHGEETVDE